MTSRSSSSGDTTSPQNKNHEAQPSARANDPTGAAHLSTFGNMKNLADIGSLVRVTPQDDIWVKNPSEKTEYIDDRTPFFMIVDGRLEDGHMFYGVYGKVTSGPERYSGLICSIITRLVADDWRIKHRSQANFKVGHTPVTRNHEFPFYHPQGTKVEGFPVFGRFGEVEVI